MMACGLMKEGGFAMKRLTALWVTALVAVGLAACATTSGNTPTEKRTAVQSMRQDVLAKLYHVKPEARGRVQGAPGYAVFSNANVNIIFASFGGGYGVVRDNQTGRDIYMKMGEFGIGLGLGVKDFRAVFIFHDHATVERFITSGWEFGGHADAAAKAGDKGAAAGGEVLADNITIYQLTESGLALQATVKGTKYWRDEELN
jgi:lipid-binding SYLF domain-containing protein